MRRCRVFLLGFTLACGMFAGSPSGYAQDGVSAPDAPVRPVANVVLAVAFADYSIAGLVTHLDGLKTFKYGIALFPGHPSIMKLRDEEGQPKFQLGGNFLIRSRRHWLDDETLVMAVDAPSDQWTSFSQGFRQDARYGSDVAALIDAASRSYGVSDWTLVGTSEGSVSAFHVARMKPDLARRLILTSSLFLAGGHGPGLSGTRWDGITARILWVHHEDDGCRFTPYRDAQRYAGITRSPLVTARGGGPARGSPCEAFSQHGFIGLERETVLAMRTWVKTGVTPADVGLPAHPASVTQTSACRSVDEGRC